MARRRARMESTGRWPDDVQIWNVRMPPSLADADIALLDRSERERAARFHRKADRVCYATTLAMPRTLLGKRIGIEPSALQFSATSRGKPELAHGVDDGTFNVSHSGEHALIAISGTGELGIDIERSGTEVDWRGLVDAVCTDPARGWPVTAARRSPRPSNSAYARSTPGHRRSTVR